MRLNLGRVSADGYASAKLKWNNQVVSYLPFSGLRETTYVKPDNIIRNAKVNGYRKPSPWSGMHLDVTGVADIPYDSWEGPDYLYEIQGNLAVWAPRGIPYGSFMSPNNVRMKVLNNIRSEVFDVAMVLAEMQGTVDTIATNLLRIGRSLEAIRQRKPTHYNYLMHGRRPRKGSVDRFNREVAGTYLEWKYGIMPTVYDTVGACEAMDINEEGSLFDNPPLLVARAADHDTEDTSLYLVGTGATVEARGETPVVVRKQIAARCDFRVDGEGLRGLNRYGLGLGSVATVAFDRTPFSFVLNMAVPIAELIKAWTALSGVQVISYCETSYNEIKPEQPKMALTLWGRTITPNVSLNVEKLNKFSRVAYTTVPFPVPFVRNPIKTGNLATVLALFTTLRRKT